MIEGKTAILGAIRRSLHRGALPEDQAAMLRARMAKPPRHLIPARTRIPHDRQVTLFIAMVEASFATVARVPDLGAIPAAIAEYLAAQNLPPSLVAGPHPELDAVNWADRPLLTVRRGRAEADDLVSVQHGFAGIAETGTLILPSGPERPNTLNLLPDTEILVLRRSAVAGCYEEVWDRLRATGGPAGFMPRTVMLVTGPSRSADIEQTLELGAHGPRRLHVILIEDGAEG
jgi:L-lactate dehydrogenase complex protein LldG